MRRGWLWALLLALGLGCPPSTSQRRAAVSLDAGRRPGPSDPTAEDFAAPPLPQAQVVLVDVFGGRHVVEVEVAATEWARARGLMWRTLLPEGKGMLFVFPQEEVHSFWMRNTLIPLDMLFISSAKEVVGIVRNAEPRTLVSRTVDRPSVYVLEVPGGFCDKVGVQAGTRVEFEGLAAQAGR